MWSLIILTGFGDAKRYGYVGSYSMSRISSYNKTRKSTSLGQSDMQFERVFGAEFHPANSNSLLTRQESGCGLKVVEQSKDMWERIRFCLGDNFKEVQPRRCTIRHFSHESSSMVHLSLISRTTNAKYMDHVYHINVTGHEKRTTYSSAWCIFKD